MGLQAAMYTRVTQRARVWGGLLQVDDTFYKGSKVRWTCKCVAYYSNGPRDSLRVASVGDAMSQGAVSD